MNRKRVALFLILVLAGVIGAGIWFLTLGEGIWGLSRGGSDPTAKVAEADQLMAQGKYAEALMPLQKAVSEGGKQRADIYYRISVCYRKQRDPQLGRAISFLQNAKQRDPGNRSYSRELVELYLSTRQAQKATVEARGLVQAEPGNDAYQRLLVEALEVSYVREPGEVQKKQFLGEAATVAAAAVAAGPKDLQNYLLQKDIVLLGEAKNKIKMAADILQTAVDKADKKAEAYRAQAEFFTQRAMAADTKREERDQLLVKAEAALQAALKADPENPETLLALARLTWGRPDKADKVAALDYLDRAIKKAPGQTDAYLVKEQMLRSQGGPEALAEARKVLDEALKNGPEVAKLTDPKDKSLRGDLLYDMANILMALQDYAAAKEYAAQLEAVAGSEVPATNFLYGKIDLQEKRYPQALERLTKAVEGQRQRTVAIQEHGGANSQAAMMQAYREGEYHFWLGLAYSAEDAPGKARAELEQSWQLLPPSDTSMRGSVAREMVRLLISTAPGDPDLEKWIKGLPQNDTFSQFARIGELIQKGMFAEAAREAQALIKAAPEMPEGYLLLVETYARSNQRALIEPTLLDGLNRVAKDKKARLYGSLLALYQEGGMDAKVTALSERAKADKDLSVDEKLRILLTTAKTDQERLAAIQAEVQSDPQNPTKLATLAAVLARMQQRDEALKLYREAFRIAVEAKQPPLARAIWDQVWLLFIEGDDLRGAEDWITKLPPEMKMEREMASGLLDLSRAASPPAEEIKGQSAEEVGRKRIAYADKAIARLKALLAQDTDQVPDIRVLKTLARAEIVKSTLPVAKPAADLDEAEKYYQKVLEFQPQDAPTRINLSSLYLGQSRLSDAQAQALEVLRSDPSNISALLLKAMAQQGAQRFNDAIETRQTIRTLLRQDKRLDPRRVPNLLVLGELLSRMLNDQVGAEAVYREAVKAAPDSLDAALHLALLLPQKGSAGRDEADALMERLVQDKPNDPNALMAASQYYFQTSRRDQAVSYAEKIIAAKPDMANGYLFLSLKYLESNDLDKAAKVLEDYLAKNAKGGSLVDVKCQLADILVLRSAYGGTTSAEAPPAAVEDLTRAKKLLNDVLQTNPGLLPAMTVLAKVFFQQANEASQQNQAAEKLQDIAQAEALLGQVVAQSPHFGEGYLLLAQCALLRGDSTKALEQLLKVQPNDSIYPRVLKLRAGIDRTRGEVEKFRTDLRQTLDLQPRDVEARVQLAELDASIHKYADAARTIQEGLQYQPDNPMLLISMAELSLSQNKLNEAQTLADKAVKILPDDPTVWGVWTKIMSAPGRGQAQEATAKLRTLVRTHLDAKASKQWLNFYLLLVRQLNSQGQWDESKPILQSLLKDHPEVPALYVVYANTLLAESGARTKGWPDKAVMNESIKVLTEAMASEKVGRKSELLRALYAIYQMQGDWVKADEVATELLKLNRDDAGAMVLHSEGLLNLKQYDDALTWAEKAVAADGLRYEAMNNIAWILSTQKSNKLDEARSWITRALKISPENPSLLDTSGWIQCLGKDYGAAILTLEHGLRGGDSAITRYHLGMAYKLKATQVTSPVLKKEAYQKADEHLKKALEMAPGDPSSADYQADAQKALAEVQKGLK